MSSSRTPNRSALPLPAREQEPDPRFLFANTAVIGDCPQRGGHGKFRFETMWSKSRLEPCVAPFEKDPATCRVCRLSGAALQLRRCIRLVAESPSMQTLMLKAAPIAASDAPVVISGESGTGKEVLARALHANSPRRNKPFLAVNVAALPEGLLESELFGHLKGAFTGASTAKRGLFEAADGGTLLLDEISEMPLALQAKLLRVLQNGEVRRVGDTRPFSVDVRVLYTTNQDLRACVARLRFREDLYYRLHVFTLLVPPLRERREDILPLARLFLEQKHHPTGGFTASALGVIESYRWPGNVRELANAVAHGAALSGRDDVDAAHLPEEIVNRRPAPAPAKLGTLAEAEREHVLRVLEACGGRQTDAARMLGIGRTTLWRKLWGVGIEAEGAGRSAREVRQSVNAGTSGRKTGPMAERLRELDVRRMAAPNRHPEILRTFDSLAPGNAFVVVIDHDPKPLLYQFQVERTGRFEWSVLEAGPERFRIEIRRRERHGPRNATEFLARDHRRLSGIFSDVARLLTAGSFQESAHRFAEAACGLIWHTDAEERVLFPAFEKATSNTRGPTVVMRAEHLEIRRLMDVTRAALSLPHADKSNEALRQLVEAVTAHSAKEVEVLYPLTDHAIGGERERDDLVRCLQAC